MNNSVYRQFFSSKTWLNFLLQKLKSVVMEIICLCLVKVDQIWQQKKLSQHFPLKQQKHIFYRQVNYNI